MSLTMNVKLLSDTRSLSRSFSDTQTLHRNSKTLPGTVGTQVFAKTFSGPQTLPADAKTFSGTQTLLMTEEEAAACTLSGAERLEILNMHRPLKKMQDPSLDRGGFKRTYLTRNKPMSDIVNERLALSMVMLRDIDDEIKSLEEKVQKDQRSLKEMDRNLTSWKSDAAKLQRKICEEEDVVKAMSSGAGLGSTIKKFDNEMQRVRSDYKQLKSRHADGISILRQEFHYNPAFKKGASGTEFSAAYHTMVRDPSRLPQASQR
jgi:hypothetical protein